MYPNVPKKVHTHLICHSLLHILDNATIKCISFTKQKFFTLVGIPITFVTGATKSDTSHTLDTPKIIDVLTTTKQMATLIIG